MVFPTVGSWISDIITPVSGSTGVNVVANYTTGSSNAEWALFSSGGTVLQDYQTVTGPFILLAGGYAMTEDITSIVGVNPFRIGFRLIGYPSLGFNPLVQNLYVTGLGAQIQFKNLGSDIQLSSTKINRFYYSAEGSYVHLLNGSWSSNNGSYWQSVNLNEEVIIPVAGSLGSEILFRASDNTGSVVLDSISFVFKQDDF